MIKIHNGTATETQRLGLCTTCANAFITESVKGSVRIVCEAIYPPQRVPELVARCNNYRDPNSPDKHELAKIAWILTTDKKAGKVGFAKPKQVSDD